MELWIDRQVFDVREAFRYYVRRRNGELLYTVDREAVWVLAPTRVLTFVTADGEEVAYLAPVGVGYWHEPSQFVLRDPQAEVIAEIRQRWTVLDQLLLHLPRFEVLIGERGVLAAGSLYGLNFYLFHPLPVEEEGSDEQGGQESEDIGVDETDPEALGEVLNRMYEEAEEETVPVWGRIEHTPAGGQYRVVWESEEVEPPPPIVLAALTILVDLVVAEC